MASNDPSPEETQEEKSLLGPDDTEDIQVSMTTEADSSEKDSAVTMTTEDTKADDIDDINDDRIEDMTRRYGCAKMNDLFGYFEERKKEEENVFRSMFKLNSHTKRRYVCSNPNSSRDKSRLFLFHGKSSENSSKINKNENTPLS